MEVRGTDKTNNDWVNYDVKVWGMPPLLWSVIMICTAMGVIITLFLGLWVMIAFLAGVGIFFERYIKVAKKRKKEGRKDLIMDRIEGMGAPEVIKFNGYLKEIYEVKRSS